MLRRNVILALIVLMVLCLLVACGIKGEDEVQGQLSEGQAQEELHQQENHNDEKSPQGKQQENHDEEESLQEESQEELQMVTSINYEIIDKTTMPLSPTTEEEMGKYKWTVFVKDKVNKEELKNLSKEIIEIAKKELEFRGIIICFCDNKDYLGWGDTSLGEVVYAPNGDWDMTSTVDIGDYENMDYSFVLEERDWDKQPTEEEVKIYKRWREILYETDFKDGLDEDLITEKTSKELGIPIEEVEKAKTKVLHEWLYYKQTY